MTVVRKALVDDFDDTYLLLKKFNNSALAKEDWKQLFINHWKTDTDYYGYVLVDDKKVVGYLGMLFAIKVIQGEPHKLCNISSWIVQKQYRNESFALLLQLLKLKTHTITIFTPNKATYLASKKLGFVDFETHSRVFIPFPTLKCLQTDCFIVEDKEEVKKFLNQKYLKIYNDHLSFNCIHLWVKTKTNNFYIILTKVFKKGIPAARIHFVSDLNSFKQTLELLTIKLCLKLRVLIVIIDDRYVKNINIPLSKRIKLPQPRVFKSEVLKSEDIDSLYSELAVLNL